MLINLEGQEKIHVLDHALYYHSTTKEESPVEFDTAYNEFLDFMKAKSETIGGGTREKIFRFLKDVLDSADNLIGIHSHRTPISLKAYCLIFIYIFSDHLHPQPSSIKLELTIRVGLPFLL